MLNFENIGEKFVKVVNSREWKELQQKFNKCNDIYVLGQVIWPLQTMQR